MSGKLCYAPDAWLQLVEITCAFPHPFWMAGVQDRTMLRMPTLLHLAYAVLNRPIDALSDTSQK